MVPNFLLWLRVVIVAVKAKARCGCSMGLKSFAGRAYRPSEIVKDVGLSVGLWFLAHALELVACHRFLVRWGEEKNRVAVCE